MTTTAKRPRRLARPLIGLALTLALAAGGVLVYQRQAAPAATATVQTATATRGELRVSVSGPGTLSATVSRVVPAKADGTIETLPSVGQPVTKGELLATIDPRDARLALDNARLALRKAQAQLATLRALLGANRASSQQSTQSAGINVRAAETNLASAQRSVQVQEQLYAVGGVARQAVEDARAGVQKARADLQTARVTQSGAVRQASGKGEADAQDLRNAQLAVEQARLGVQQAQDSLAYTKVYAPLTGVVSEVSGAAGSAAQSGQALFTIIDPGSVDLPVQVDETQIAGVKTGQEADVTLDATGERTFGGRVVSVAPAATTQNNIAIFTVTVRIPNGDGALRPGMSAEADIVSQDVQGAILVPEKALSQVRTRSYVQVVGASGRTERRRVHTGASDGASVVVTQGLQEGDKVVLPTSGVGTSGSGAGGANSGRSNPGGFGGPPPGGGF